MYNFGIFFIFSVKSFVLFLHLPNFLLLKLYTNFYMELFRFIMEELKLKQSPLNCKSVVFLMGKRNKKNKICERENSYMKYG